VGGCVNKAPSLQGTGLSFPRYHPTCFRLMSKAAPTGTGTRRTFRYPLPVNGGRSVCAYWAALGKAVRAAAPGRTSERPGWPGSHPPRLAGHLQATYFSRSQRFQRSDACALAFVLPENVAHAGSSRQPVFWFLVAWWLRRQAASPRWRHYPAAVLEAFHLLDEALAGAGRAALTHCGYVAG
jgi:hypothetical protein